MSEGVWVYGLRMTSRRNIALFTLIPMIYPDKPAGVQKHNLQTDLARYTAVYGLASQDGVKGRNLITSFGIMSLVTNGTVAVQTTLVGTQTKPNKSLNVVMDGTTAGENEAYTLASHIEWICAVSVA